MLSLRLKLIISVVAAILLELYAFNFVPRDITVIGSRTLGRQLLDYAVNFILFTVAICFLLSLIVFIFGKVTSSKR